MKSRNTEKGSAHLVIIVTLVIVVLGLLGFVFWQNVNNKPAINKGPTTTTTQSSPATQVNDTGSAKTLAVNEWGVKGSYVSDETIGYTLNQYGNVVITDVSLTGMCDSFGSISRGMASESAVVGSTESGKTNQQAYDAGYGFARAHVGTYYYFYTSPQASCQKGADVQDKAVKAAEDFLTGLQSS